MRDVERALIASCLMSWIWSTFSFKLFRIRFRAWVSGKGIGDTALVKFQLKAAGKSEQSKCGLRVQLDSVDPLPPVNLDIGHGPAAPSAMLHRCPGS